MTTLLLRSSTRLPRRPPLLQCHQYRWYPAVPVKADPPPLIKPARTRFAPSPTGFMHLGSLRTALYNYLLAKNTEGQFILRIEDTDQKRTVKGAEESIMETLRWAGLQWDEGPEVGGNYGPYKQSKRTALYRAHAEQLLLDGTAYRCFCGPLRLEALAATRQVAGLPVEYDRRCHNLTSAESDRRAAAGESHVIRLLAPDAWPSFADEVYGRIQNGSNKRAHAEGSFEDPILLKSDGSPTYHLANVVDDHFMEITHVVRGAEWMPSTPKHAQLYKCFGWQPPKFVHVGLLMGKDRQKLSKRNGSVMVSEYRESGCSPEALINFVALLGWSHGGAGKSDLMTMEQLVQKFDIKGLTAGNTIVNSEKLPFLQKGHLRMMFNENKDIPESEVAKVEAEVRTLYGDKLETGKPITTDYIRAVVKADFKNYLNPAEFAEKSNHFFTSPTFDSKDSIKAIVNFRKLTGMSTSEIYYGFIDAVAASPWDLDSLKALQLYGQDLDEEAWKARMRLLRIAICGGRNGPSIADTMHIIGKERVLQRLKDTDKAFVEFKGELEAAEAQHNKEHSKLLKKFQEQWRHEEQEQRGEKKPSKKLDNRREAMLRMKMGSPPMERKGYRYMPAEMKKRVQTAWDEEKQVQVSKMLAPRVKEQRWEEQRWKEQRWEEQRWEGEKQGRSETETAKGWGKYKAQKESEDSEGVMKRWKPQFGSNRWDRR